MVRELRSRKKSDSPGYIETRCDNWTGCSPKSTSRDGSIKTFTQTMFDGTHELESLLSSTGGWQNHGGSLQQDWARWESGSRTKKIRGRRINMMEMTSITKCKLHSPEKFVTLLSHRSEPQSAYRAHALFRK
jgi:hypothetical protein